MAAGHLFDSSYIIKQILNYFFCLGFHYPVLVMLLDANDARLPEIMVKRIEPKASSSLSYQGGLHYTACRIEGTRNGFPCRITVLLKRRITQSYTGRKTILYFYYKIPTMKSIRENHEKFPYMIVWSCTRISQSDCLF